MRQIPLLTAFNSRFYPILLAFVFRTGDEQDRQVLIAFTEGTELAIDIEARSVTSAILYKSAWAIWSVVTESAQAIGIGRFGAHNLRRPAPMYGPPPCRKRKVI